VARLNEKPIPALNLRLPWSGLQPGGAYLFDKNGWKPRIKATEPESDEAFFACETTLNNCLIQAENYDAIGRSEAASLRRAEEHLASLERGASGEPSEAPPSVLRQVVALDVSSGITRRVLDGTDKSQTRSVGSTSAL
jgi:hypothetical protein